MRGWCGAFGLVRDATCSVASSAEHCSLDAPRGAMRAETLAGVHLTAESGTQRVARERGATAGKNAGVPHPQPPWVIA